MNSFSLALQRSLVSIIMHLALFQFGAFLTYMTLFQFGPFFQLAVLATYVGDELLAVYRYFRSLAVESPFLTARDNLIILFEKVRCGGTPCCLSTISGSSQFT